MAIEWGMSQTVMNIMYGINKPTMWDTQSTASVFGQQPVINQAQPTLTSDYFTKPTPKPFYTVTSLGPASPYADMMPLNITMARQKYGYNEPGAVPFVGPTSVDTFEGKKKVRTETMTVEQSAMVYAPVQAGRKDMFKEDREYFAGKKLDKVKDSKGKATLPPTYQSQWDEKNKAGTWWKQFK